MISPTILNTPTVLRYPHIYHDSPHGTEHPTVLKISPTFITIPHGNEHPHGTQDIHPRYTHDIRHGILMGSPMVLSTPDGTEHPPAPFPTVLHTHYTGV